MVCFMNLNCEYSSLDYYDGDISEEPLHFCGLRHLALPRSTSNLVILVARTKSFNRQYTFTHELRIFYKPVATISKFPRLHLIHICIHIYVYTHVCASTCVYACVRVCAWRSTDNNTSGIQSSPDIVIQCSKDAKFKFHRPTIEHVTAQV